MQGNASGRLQNWIEHGWPPLTNPIPISVQTDFEYWSIWMKLLSRRDTWGPHSFFIRNAKRSPRITSNTAIPRLQTISKWKCECKTSAIFIISQKKTAKRKETRQKMHCQKLCVQSGGTECEDGRATMGDSLNAFNDVLFTWNLMKIYLPIIAAKQFFFVFGNVHCLAQPGENNRNDSDPVTVNKRCIFTFSNGMARYICLKHISVRSLHDGLLSNMQHLFIIKNSQIHLSWITQLSWRQILRACRGPNLTKIGVGCVWQR